MTSLWAKAAAKLSEEDRIIFQCDRADRPSILRDILLAVEQQRDRRRRKNWKIKGLHGEQIVIRDVCAKISCHIKRFVEVGDVAVQFDPIHAALPWAGLRFILQLTLSNVETFDAVVEGLERISSVVARCAIIEALYLPAKSDAEALLEEELLKLYAGVLSFLCEARRYFQKSALGSLIAGATRRKPLQDSLQVVLDRELNFQTQKGLVDGEKLRSTSTFTERTNVTVEELQSKLQLLEAPVSRGLDQVSRLHSALEEAHRNTILRWLSPVHYGEHHKATLNSLLPQSGLWLTTEPVFTMWRDSSTSETFWLYGIPGCGKTSLVAAVIEHLRHLGGSTLNTSPVAYFYCSRNPAEPQRSDCRKILQALAKQLSLAGNGDDVRMTVVDEYERRQSEARKYGGEVEPLTTEDCVKLICELANTSPAMIVIDALDECDPHQRHSLLSALEEIRSRSRDVVKTFVSSRLEDDIGAILWKGRSVQVTSKENANDLERFVLERARQFIKRWSSMHSRTQDILTSLEREIIETLLEGAHGMFLWVTLQLHGLCNTQKIKFEHDIRAALACLPLTLSDSYEVIYKRIQSMGPRSKAVAVSALRWLLCAQQALSIPDFTAAISKTSDGCEETSQEDIISCCCNLVVLDLESNVFRLAHPTVREYFESLENFSRLECHSAIAMRCLGTYIWGDHFDDSLLNYATHFWAAHCENLSGPHERLALKNSLIEFLTAEEHLEDWLQQLGSKAVKRLSSGAGNLARKLDAASSTPPSPLFVICCFGLSELLDNTEILEIVDFGQRNNNDTSGLYLAARWGHVDVVKQFIKHGADVNAPGYQFGTALQAAAFAGHESIVMLLLEQGASFSGSGQFSSPLQAALASGHESIVNVLLDSGFKFATQKEFDDAFDTASFNGYASVVQQLLDGKAGAFAEKESHDPLHAALYARQERKSLRLLEACDDINAQWGYFGNALQGAILGGKLSLVKAVVEAGASFGQRGRFGYPLRAAALSGRIEIVEYLLDQGADPNAKDDELGDPLQAAASKGHLAIMKILLARGAEVNGYGGFFGNSLQACAFAGHEQAARFLLEHGAAPGNHGNGRFRHALHAAVYAGHDNIACILLQHGGHEYTRQQIRSMIWKIKAESGQQLLPSARNSSKDFETPDEESLPELAVMHGDDTVATLLIDEAAKLDLNVDFTVQEPAEFWYFLSLLHTKLDKNMTLSDFGVDSVTAIELRNWLLENLDIDLSIFRILSLGRKRLGAIAAEGLQNKMKGKSVDGARLANRLHQAMLAQKKKDADLPASIPSHTTETPQVAFIFTGQGAPWPRMGFELLQFPVFRESVEKADLYLKTVLHCSWSVREEFSREQCESSVNKPQYSLPLCTILQVALVDLLESWNIVPIAVAGHSSGEIAAAYSIGALTQEHAWKIAYHGGTLSETIPSMIPLKGAMMVAGLSEEDAETWAEKVESGQIVVGCVNSPSSVTMSGDADGVDELQELLRDERVFHRKLRGEIAYHSPHMNAIATTYYAAISGVEPRPAREGRCMYSTVTGELVEASELGATYWVRNLISPVLFSSTVTSLLRPHTSGSQRQENNVNIIVEVGPHPALAAPLRQIMKANNIEGIEYLSVLSRGRNAVHTAMDTANALSAKGVPVEMSKVNAIGSSSLR